MNLLKFPDSNSCSISLHFKSNIFLFLGILYPFLWIFYLLLRLRLCHDFGVFWVLGTCLYYGLKPSFYLASSFLQNSSFLASFSGLLEVFLAIRFLRCSWSVSRYYEIIVETYLNFPFNIFLSSSLKSCF